MPADSRTLDRAVHYTMKTARPQPVSSHSFSHVNPHNHSHHVHSHAHSRSVASSHSCRPPKSTTPLGSPTVPPSVGQPQPPKLSPGPTAPSVRSSSPNYFGLTVEPAHDLTDSSAVPVGNWSPPSSSVKSFAAALPKQLPLDANPEFEAFKRQADLNRGASFSFNGSVLGGRTPAAGTPAGNGGMRLRPPQSRRSGLQNHVSTPVPSQEKTTLDPSNSLMDIDGEKVQDSAYGSADSKRNSEESTISQGSAPNLSLEMPPHQSPAQVESLLAMAQRSTLARLDERQARMSMDQNRDKFQLNYPRADSLPSKLESGGPSMLAPSQLRDMLEGTREEDMLLLDIRVSPQYAVSRIKGALNLCIPTTLLKRATFDLQKLQQTFHNEKDQERFSKWRSTKCLVVYDASSLEKRDAQSAINMLKKFTNGGYAGATYILRGGFNFFADAYPDLVDRHCGAERSGSCLSLNDNAGPRPKVAPVVGGVMLPTSNNGANPFFSNIRQNIDLQDGVGQLDVKLPKGMDLNVLPRWLRKAADPSDHGKEVSEKFLHIEKTEQSRMKSVYASFGAPTYKPGTAPVQLCGIEKGGKNRYKDILPFEHTRVKLQNKPSSGCDYVNASHIKSSRSNKRYIASQGPLPATFQDFWSVIWDQDVRVIVMLTAESEGGQLKCHSYWCDKEFGPIRLRTISEKKVSLDIDKHRQSSAVSVNSSSSQETARRRANTTTTLHGRLPTPQLAQSQADTPFVIIRKFALQNSACPFAPIREVTHLHYPSWPDFGAPAQPAHLLALVELANVMQRAATPVNSTAVVSSSCRGSPEPAPLIPGVDEPEPSSNARPMLVHCSAGCGRTGAFCTVDTVIDMLKRQRSASLQNVPKDADGDVPMDRDDSISPMTITNPHPLPSLASSPSLSKKAPVPDEDKDLDLSWLHDDSVDFIQKTVEDFRQQRLSMVQTLRQYVLCYETVLEWIWRAHDRNLILAGSDASIRGRARSGSLGTTSLLGLRSG